MGDSDNIVKVLDDAKALIEQFETTLDRTLLAEIEALFGQFAQLVTTFLISERDLYYGYFFLSMRFRAVFNEQLIAGIRLNEYPATFAANPLLLFKFSLKEIIYIFCHEVDHVVFSHPAEMSKAMRSTEADVRERFNYAADASVNDMLNHEIARGKKFLKAPEGAVTSKTLKGKFGLANVAPMQSYRYYFDLIKDLEITSGDDGPSRGVAPVPGMCDRLVAGRVDASAKEGVPRDLESARDAQDSTQSSSSSLTDHDWVMSGTDGYEMESSENISEMTRQLLRDVNEMMSEEARSLMPGRFSCAVARAYEPPQIDWAAMFKRYVGTVSAEKVKTRSRLNRRQPLRFDLSGSRDNKVVKVVVAIDTSASMSDDQLKAVFAEILGILSRHPFELTVIECDSAVQRVYRLDGAADIPASVMGRGGTAFTPAIRYVNEHRCYRDALLVYFTDGFGERRIPRPLTYRSLWVVTGDKDNLSVEEPYGTVLSLEGGQ